MNSYKNEIKSAMKNPVKNTFTSDNLRIRDGLNALGFDNNKIGWDGENVTYNNNLAFKPTSNDNGTTKTDTKSFIEGVNRLYGSSGNSLADVTSYAAMSGISNSVEYGGDGSVSICGVQIPNTIIIDGQAYASTSDIKSALNAATNTSNQMDIFNKSYGSKGKYTDTIDALVKKLAERDEFSYNPENDPAYLAYKKQYEALGSKASDDMYGKYAAKSGGYGNSAAISSSVGAYYDYMNKLTDKIPELYKDAYSRYRSDFQDNMDLLSKLGTPKDIYSYEQSANKTLRDEINAAMNANEDRNRYIADTQINKDNEAYDRDFKNRELENKQNQYNIENGFKERELSVKENDNERENKLLPYEIQQILAKIANLNRK